MKLIRRQKVWLSLVVAVNLALWLIPSDVVEQIARDRQTMLGRYSRGHFTWIVVVAVLSLISIYIDLATGQLYKRRWFQVLAVCMFLFPTLVVADFFLRTPQRLHYVRDSVAYHRPAEAEFHDVFEDKPEAYRTYPQAPPGYGLVDSRLSTDLRGFRNRKSYRQCDVVVLGDSFAEGSKVSDEHVWVALVEDATGLAVYNLGMSGYSPAHYLASLETYGLDLTPRYVICLLYEGNDFRSTAADSSRRTPGLSKRIKTYFKQSPILEMMDRLLIETFGRLNSHSSVPGIEVLDWLPLAVPPGTDAKHYTFAPKQLRDLYPDKEQIEGDRRWHQVRSLLSKMNSICASAGCRFAVVYAPTKAHVLLPLAAKALPTDKVRDFAAMSYKKKLPDPEIFLSKLLSRVDARESAVGDWCSSASIPFMSLTGDLRDAASAGIQVYYTYDQHWTPTGHQVVASTIQQFLSESIVAGSAKDAPP